MASVISDELPTAFDVACSERLERFMEEASPLETADEQLKRQQILVALAAIFQDWVRSVCLSKGLTADVADRAGGQVYTSGSYRLGINEKGMDIDTICVAPRHVTREDFFDSLKVILEDHDSVENLSSIESAVVPIITFDFDSVNIDLLFASLPVDAVPRDFDINDDNVLRGADVGSEKSLNGPRATNMIERLVPSFDSFIRVLRCVRLWAKRRGLYSNKMGYFGGINCNILTAFVCQLYPRAAPSLLLERFFFILRDWKWPTVSRAGSATTAAQAALPSSEAAPQRMRFREQPIMLTPPYDAGLGLEVWDPQNGNNRFHSMPILTPAYPSMNSSMSVSRGTLEVIRAEMSIAHDKVHASSFSCVGTPPTQTARPARQMRAILETRRGDGWADLFEPTDFVVAHQKYIACEIYVSDFPNKQAQAEALRAWSGCACPCACVCASLLRYRFAPPCLIRAL